jgi:mercuric ion transport protein
MEKNRLFKVGAVGAIIAAICCFTPVLVILLAALGLSSLVGLLDVVLLPILGLFIGLMVYAYFKPKKSEPQTP